MMAPISRSLAVFTLLFLLLSGAAEHLTHKLNHVWTNREVQSPLAKQIRDNQNHCTPTYHHHALKNYGMGADIHIWTQAVCNSMQVGLTLTTSKLNWIWNDKKFCNGTGDASLHPLGCYFNIKATCKGSVPVSKRPIVWLSTLDRCPKYIQDIAGRKIFRASAIEYMFSNLNPKLVELAEKAIPDVFGSEGIPKDLITLHLRLGDKATEMKLVKIEEYVNAIETIVSTNHMTHPHLFITTESLEGLVQLKEKVVKRGKNWKIHYYSPAVYPEKSDISPIKMAGLTSGSLGLHSLVSLLLAAEGRYYVLTTGSNWSRLVDEVRASIVNADCHNCTQVVDLREGTW